MKPFNLEEYLKNPNQKVIARDGRNVKILSTNFYQHGKRFVIAEVEGDDRQEDGQEVLAGNIAAQGEDSKDDGQAERDD